MTRFVVSSTNIFPKIKIDKIIYTIKNNGSFYFSPDNIYLNTTDNKVSLIDKVSTGSKWKFYLVSGTNNKFTIQNTEDNLYLTNTFTTDIYDKNSN